MSITVCVSASSTDGALATTAQLRAMLSTTSTFDDSNMQLAIVRASRWAESYLNYPILEQVYSECVAGYGTQRLMLGRTPIRAVMRVFNATTTESATVYTSTSYRVEAESGFLVLLPGGSYFPWTAVERWGAGRRVEPGSEIESWYVEYAAGYSWPGTTTTCYGTISTGPTLPEDLQGGILQKAALFYSQSENLLSQKIGDLALTFRSEGGSEGDPRDIAERALGPYRRGW
jgi:hypothetical protein